jgi:hypothetical protein
MNTRRFQPQMSQMNADGSLEFLICANLRHLRLNQADTLDLRAIKNLKQKGGGK